MTQTKTGSPFYLLSLSNMLDLIHRTSVHSGSLLYFDGAMVALLFSTYPLTFRIPKKMLKGKVT